MEHLILMRRKVKRRVQESQRAPQNQKKELQNQPLHSLQNQNKVQSKLLKSQSLKMKRNNQKRKNKLRRKKRLNLLINNKVTNLVKDQ